MSQLVSRILLAMLLLPLAGLLYFAAFVVSYEIMRGPWIGEVVFLWTGGITWGFIAAYWLLLWRNSIRWTRQRAIMTVFVTAAALAGGVFIGAVVYLLQDEVGMFLGTATAPLLWLGGTILAWRESAEERARRARASSSDGIVCPSCGYNLMGLSEARCPECGTRFTLEELFAAQPTRAGAEIER